VSRAQKIGEEFAERNLTGGALIENIKDQLKSDVVVVDRQLLDQLEEEILDERLDARDER